MTLTDVAALGHIWNEPTYAWNDAHTRLTATRVCARDGSHKEIETVNATSEITTPATCTAMGKTTYTSNAFANAAFSAQSITVTDIPMTAHTWLQVASVAAGEADGFRGGVVCAQCQLAQQENRVVSAQKVMRIPAMMKIIDEEAFCGIAAEQVVIPSGAASVGSRAFADCGRLLLVVIPDSVTSIEDDAFEDSDVAVICPDGSYAAGWCDEKGIEHNP